MTPPALGRRSASYDVVVVGLGIVGLSALYEVASRGARVLGLDAHPAGHRLGSSHGTTRIFRRAYWEGERFVPLLNRSLRGWHDLAAAAGEPLLMPTGGVFLGSPGSPLVAGSLTTARTCGIGHAELQAAQVSARFPAFRPSAGTVAVYEPDAGVILAERAQAALLRLARAAGADVVHGVGVRGLAPGRGGGVIVDADGLRASCGTAVVAAGGWIGRLLPGDLAHQVSPMRVPVFEFDVRGRVEDHRPERFPVFLAESGDGALLYGLPALAGPGTPRVKVGFHNRQRSPMDPDGERRPATAGERLEVWRAVSALLPGLSSAGVGTSCVYTMTRDDSFLVGRSRAIDGVVYASACSGHGFKFAPALGEALAQLAVEGRCDADLPVLRPAPLMSAS